MNKKEQKQYEKLLNKYQAITLDLEAATSLDNPSKHWGEVEYNVKRLKQNNDKFDTLVSGSGTGKP